MKVLYIDAFAGVAGDMLAAALLDLGGDLEALRRGLGALPLRGYRIETERVWRGPFRALRFRVQPEPGEPADGHAHGHAHDHDHAHDHGHAHGHDHGHAHDHELLPPATHAPADEPSFPGQPSRRWRDIRALLQAAPLPPRAQARALAAFARLAAAEAETHGLAEDDVHFHEVGGVDAIVDIVSVALLLDQLGVDELVASPLPVGAGTVRSAHGRIPLPAPATLLLLRGWPVEPGPPGELCTPTGAALVTALATPGPFPSMRLDAVGVGAGTRDPASHPNVLRAVLGHVESHPSPPRIDVLAAQMDDLAGEQVPTLLQALLDAGAVDAFATPILMKKGRPGFLVEAHADPALTPAVERAFFLHGSTFGVRRHRLGRRMLARRFRSVETAAGPIPVKIGLLDGVPVQFHPEDDAVRSRAAAAGLPAHRVASEAKALATRAEQDDDAPPSRR